ncbi:MAG: aldose 1-epimerase family protein [Bacteroidota bacterium]
MAEYILSNTILSIKVNSLGAELCSVKSVTTNIEYIWQADSALWARHAPHLFPVVGKLKQGKYVYQNNTYELPQHGFARDHEFVCIEQTEQSISFEFTATEQTLVHFPFHFSLQVTYTLQEDVVTVAYSVYNPDNRDLYFSLGAHPAFNCPLEVHETFEDYELQLNGMNVLNVNKLEDGLILDEHKTLHLSEHLLHLKPSLFEKDALVLKDTQIHHIKLSSTRSGHGVEMECQGWPYFGIWTKPGTSKFLCLEPWHGIADSVNATGKLEDKEGIITLKPETYFKSAFTLKFL